jgi:hypothetical protein
MLLHFCNRPGTPSDSQRPCREYNSGNQRSGAGRDKTKSCKERTTGAPRLYHYYRSLNHQTTRPTKADILQAAEVVHLKDAPIVAAAAKGKAAYLATHDVKHLLSHAQAIEAAYEPVPKSSLEDP